MNAGRSRNKMYRMMTCLLLAVMLLAMNFTNLAVAADESAEPQILAEWQFADEGENGVSAATGGAYQAAALFQNVGATFEYYSSKALSYQGWGGDYSQKYWLAAFPTKGFKNITLSSEQTSSGSGPRDFKVQLSTDGQAWSDVANTNIQMTAISSFTCPDDACKLKNVALPEAANDQELIYVRWIVRSGFNTKGEPNAIGGGGSSLIRNIAVQGERTDNAGIIVPTIDIFKLPKDAAENVPVEEPLTVKFNKAIATNAGSALTIVDDENVPVHNVAAEIVNGNTIKISHPQFKYSKTYTVTIPQTFVTGTDDTALVRGISWSFTTQASPFAPKLINMTFNGDPKSSIAFAWYTDQMTDTVVQVAEASKVQGNVFPDDEALIYKGTAEEIATFMKTSDRDSKTYAKFISHKAIADQLKPGTAYKYRVGNGNADGWSAIGSFTTDTAGNQPFRFIAGSDSQASSKSDFEPWADTFRKAVDFIGNPKFLINAGDLVDNGDLEEQWQWMLDAAQQSLANVPFVPVLGGHEVNDYDGDVTTPNNNFYNHFNLPKQVVAGTHEGSVYAFEYGDALFMVFNSQFEGALAEDGKTVDWADKEFWDQVAWMKNTVAKSDKKWKFVTFHKGPYGAGDNSAQWEDERVQFYKKYLIPAFDEMGIDMVFEAHDHMYMRSFQMYNDEIVTDIKFDEQGNALNPKGTVYLMSNAFGNKFYTKNNKHYIDENGDAQELLDENGNPIPYDDYFAAIDEQPFKKMFTDVSVADQVLAFTAYTAAVEDAGKAGAVGEGLVAYDKYGIKRTDVKPAKAENAKVRIEGGKAVISWSRPAVGPEPVRGFRIYEKNDKVKQFWSVYVPAEEGKSEYSYTLDNINADKKYDFIIKAVGTRLNSDPVEVSTIEGPVEHEPPSAPADLQGKAMSAYQVHLTWSASPGSVPVSGYNVYRNGVKVGAVNASTLSYQDTGLSPDTIYTYKVTAVSAEDIESLASNEVQVTTKRPAAGQGPFKAFPQHTAYAGGTIKPSHVTQAEMDATVKRLYDEWKKKYLKQNPYAPDQYYVWYADGDWFEDGEITVSEAHGYGMLITAIMAGHDAEAKKYFDGMYRYFKAHPSEINPELMAWQQADNGTAIIDINGADSATDGDMDIAYALLLAHEQWGSAGEINYFAQARKLIDAIMQSEVNQTEWTLRIADWATDGKYAGATRPSDFMLQHMKDYRIVSGDSRWDQVIDKTYTITQSLFEKYSPNAGLLPDFVVKGAQGHIPAPPLFLESEYDGDYNYNSSRVPWRIGTDYLLTGDTRAKAQLSMINKWIRETTNEDPKGVMAGYKLDGSEPIADYEDISFTAPFMVSAMIDGANQQWLNKLWDYNVAVKTEDDLYFGNNLRLLSMIVVSGNWWTPAITDMEAPSAPVNLRAESVSSTRIDLKWTASTDNLGVAGYKIFRDGKEIAETTDTFYSDTGLSPGTLYQYYVIAFDAAGNFSKASNARNVATLQGGSDTGGIIVSPPSDWAYTFSAGSSGVANLGDKVKIIIPEGATTQQLKLAIEQLAQTDQLIVKGETLLSPIFEIRKNFADKFSKPVTLIFGFDAAKLQNNQVPAVFYFDEAAKKWVKLGGKVKDGKIEVAVDQFYKFAVMAVDQSDETVTEPGKPSFKDISGHWAETDIRQALADGIVKGYADGTFKPGNPVSRAEFTVMLMRVLKPQTAGAELSFTDKAAIGGWALQAVSQAADAQIVKGYTDGSFRPNAPISRAEMVKIIAAVVGIDDDATGTTSFADDRTIPAWAKKAAETAEKRALILGRSGNKFVPEAVTSRAEAVTILLRMQRFMEK
ncbi:glycosyl hydrolase family 8 [Paenibacillus sp. GCM10027626]|uniref:glycosyl hydrolase family 8 n=1 Tax=Paenibacillus sp. GCM10027626 TaxID=3273411 RepID=UPI0036254F61